MNRSASSGPIVAPTTPSRKTMIRSATWVTSRRSEEAHRIVAPFVRHEADLSDDLASCADVDAECRLVEQQQVGAERESLRQHHFLLIAARELVDCLIDACGANIENLHHSVGLRARFGEAQKAHEPAQTAKDDESDVLRDRLRKHEPVNAAVFRNEKDAVVHRVLRRIRSVAFVTETESRPRLDGGPRTACATASCGRFPPARRRQALRREKPRTTHR